MNESSRSLRGPLLDGKVGWVLRGGADGTTQVAVPAFAAATGAEAVVMESVWRAVALPRQEVAFGQAWLVNGTCGCCSTLPFPGRSC